MYIETRVCVHQFMMNFMNDMKSSTYWQVNANHACGLAIKSFNWMQIQYKNPMYRWHFFHMAFRINWMKITAEWLMTLCVCVCACGFLHVSQCNFCSIHSIACHPIFHQVTNWLCTMRSLFHNCCVYKLQPYGNARKWKSTLTHQPSKWSKRLIIGEFFTP